MKNFKDFEIENQELIFGGEIQNCTYTASDGSTGKDKYDTERRTITYVQ